MPETPFTPQKAQLAWANGFRGERAYRWSSAKSAKRYDVDALPYPDAQEHNEALLCDLVKVIDDIGCRVREQRD